MIKNFLNSVIRFLIGLKRPSKKTNLRKLQERGETLDSFTFRDATEKDVVELGKLHAITWAQTYNAKTPNIQLRQYQWQKSFTENNDGTWFCILVVNKSEELIGFAKGIIHKEANELNGEINKIYLLTHYQRLGLGTKLFQVIVQRFLSKGINKMHLYGTPQNPSCRFHDAMGGERLITDNGVFHGGYEWTDLKKITTL